MALYIVRNDITKVAADAIVNTANPRPIFANGTDGAIYKAAGTWKLLAARKKIGNIAPGEAVETPAFNLKAKYIIHTVGPSWVDGKHGEAETLKSCYEKSLLLAEKLECQSIAFPLIATGVYGFPKDKALQIALAVIQDFLLEHSMSVTLVVFSDEAFHLSGQIADNIREYVDSNYVENAYRTEYSGGYQDRTRRAQDMQRNENVFAQARLWNSGRTLQSDMSFESRMDDEEGATAGYTAGEYSAEEPEDYGPTMRCHYIGEEDEDIDEGEDFDEGDVFDKVEPDIAKVKAFKAAAPAKHTAPMKPEASMTEAPMKSKASMAEAPMKPEASMTEAPMKSKASMAEAPAKAHTFGEMKEHFASDSAFKRVDLDELLKNSEKTFQQKLFEIIDSRGLTGPQVYGHYVSKQVYSKILADIYYHPNKFTALALCLSLHLNLDQTLDLIGRAGWTLSPSSKADIVVKGCILMGEYNLVRVNILLYQYGCPTLEHIK